MSKEEIEGSVYLNKICIKHGNFHSPPSVVFVSGISTMLDTLICREINSSTVSFGGTFEDFDFYRLEELVLRWKIEDAQRTITSSENSLKEIIGNKNDTK